MSRTWFLFCFFFLCILPMDSGRRISSKYVYFEPSFMRHNVWFENMLISHRTRSKELVDRKWMCDEVNGCSEIPHFPLNCLVGGKTISKAHKTKQFNILCENLYGSFCPKDFFGFEPFAGWCIHSSSRIRTWWALLAKRWWGFLAAGSRTKCVCCIRFS